MKKFILPIIALLAITSCQKSAEDLQSEMDTLIKSEEINSTEGQEKLAILQEQYATRKLKSGESYDSISNFYLYAAGLYQDQAGNSEKSMKLFEEYLMRDDSSGQFRDAAITLAKLKSEKGNHQESADLIAEVLESQIPTAGQWFDITKITLAKIASGKVGVEDYLTLVQGYTATRNFSMALQTLDTVIIKNPNDDKQPEWLLRGGFIAWEYMNDATAAQKYYSEFLTKYPNHSQAPGIRNLVDNGFLTMSNEDILNALKEKRSNE